MCAWLLPHGLSAKTSVPYRLLAPYTLYGIIIEMEYIHFMIIISLNPNSCTLKDGVFNNAVPSTVIFQASFR